MKLTIETWLESQQVDPESKSSFEESFICFKVGAYKAALLFAYLGFAGVIRARVLGAQAPTGLVPAHWTTLQNNVRKAETWDKTVFDATQQQQPAPVFRVSSDLRSQVSYWKDRRNDCAHSKANKIVDAHVEAFYAFVESNLGKFAVNGSRPAMVTRILNFYNPSLTPPNQAAAPVVQEIGHAIPINELDDFLRELSQEFHSRRTPSEVALNKQSGNKVNFISNCIRYGTEELKRACTRLLLTDDNVLLAYLRENPADVYVLQNQPNKVRQLWHEFLFTSGQEDFALLAALLRQNLIPAGEIAEAMEYTVEKPIDHVPNAIDSTTLDQHGFYAALEQTIADTTWLRDFDWANGSKALVVHYLAQRAITREVALAIYSVFNGAHHPWHLRDDLNEFFRANPTKKQEFDNHLGSNPAIGRPTHIASLA